MSIQEYFALPEKSDITHTSIGYPTRAGVSSQKFIVTYSAGAGDVVGKSVGSPGSGVGAGVGDGVGFRHTSRDEYE